MPLRIEQTDLMAAIDEADLGRKFWANETGVLQSRLSEYAHGSRPMPEDVRERLFAALARERPDLAARLVRDVLRPHGLTVELAQRPDPAATSRRAHSAVAREFADLTTAWADADEDGHHDAPELARRLREIRQLREALASYETVTAQELVDAEKAAGVGHLPFQRNAS
jgi:hypothetical protein